MRHARLCGVAFAPLVAIVPRDREGCGNWYVFGAYQGWFATNPTITSARGQLMFITPAYAQGLGGSNDMLMSLLPFVGIFVIMYFLILRPQQKRVKQHQELVKNVRRGDTVVTSGGIVAKVTKVIDDEQIEIEIADGVRARQVRSMVSDVRAKGEPVKEDAAS